MQETQEAWVQSPVQEDPLEKEVATHSSILAQKIPWTGGVQRARVHGVAKSLTQMKQLSTHVRVRRTKKKDGIFIIFL